MKKQFIIRQKFKNSFENVCLSPKRWELKEVYQIKILCNLDPPQLFICTKMMAKKLMSYANEVSILRGCVDA